MHPKNNKNLLTLILSGTTLEWLEFIYFIQIAGIIVKNFFPEGNGNYLYPLLLSSYFSRPLGSIIFGYIGDKIGRKPAMLLSLSIMATASFSMAIIPSYNNIGLTATVLVFLVRTLQCLALPGEFTGAAIVTLEEPRFKNNIFFYMSFIPFAASCGMVLASISSYFINLPNTPGWAWRVPFMISGMLGIFAILLRSSMQETLVTSSRPNDKAHGSNNFYLAFLNVFLFGALISLWVYLGNVFFKNFYISNTGQNASEVSLVVTIGQILATMLMLAFGKLADKNNNGTKICKIGLILAVILAIPMTLATTSQDKLLWYISQVSYALVNGMLSATLFTLTFKKFTREYRFRASSISWNISSAIFGGTALYIGSCLNKIAPGVGVGIYIAILAAVTYLAFTALLCKSEGKEKKFL